MGHLNSEILS